MSLLQDFRIKNPTESFRNKYSNYIREYLQNILVIHQLNVDG